jgi:iron complex transport system ATP-binding protein
VLLDEPTTHLDIGHQLDLLHRVRELVHGRGLTAVAALHDLNLAARYADRIVVLARGRQVADGPPREVLSGDLLARVWGVDAEVRVDARSGLPYLVPRRLVTYPASPSAQVPGTVHVVGGGGSASAILRALAERGFHLSTGVLHLLDTDTETAEALGVPTAVEAPFAPVGPIVRARHRELLQRASAIVVAPFVVGPSNLANLEDLRPFAGVLPIFLLSRPSIGQRDFCAGAATTVYGELRARGAIEVDDPETLAERLRSVLTSRAAATAPLGSPAPGAL